MTRIPIHVYIGDRVRYELSPTPWKDPDMYIDGVVVGFESDTHTLVQFGSDSEPQSIWTHRLKVIGRGPNAPPGSPLSTDFPRLF